MTNELDKLLSQKEKLEKKIELEDFKIRQSKYFENSKKRKERTRVLIQKGALLDKYFETENLTPDQTEEFLKIFVDYVNSNKPDKYKEDRKNI